MGDVVIAGIGQIPVAEHWEIPLRSMAVKAARTAINDAGGLQPEALYIGNFLASAASHQANLGALIAEHSGFSYLEAFTAEAGEASGAVALHMAYLAIKSGFIDAALVIGVEKVTDRIGQEIEMLIAESADYDFEGMQGLTPYGQAALLMQAYLERYQAQRESFAVFPLLAHQNAARNANALFQRAISLDRYQQAPIVNAPLNLMDAAPYADGAAAILVASEEVLPEDFPHPVISIKASEIATDALALHDRIDILAFNAVKTSVRRSLQKAAIKLEDIDFFECWDSASIFALLSLESAGFFPRGLGWKEIDLDKLGIQGELPLITMGGNKARGFPLGAAGVYQAVEAVLQLRGQAGKNQIRGIQTGMIQALGGSASTTVTHILQID